MKTDTVFKRAFNDALDLVSKLAEGEQLPSENTLSAQLGVSRTTVRKVLSVLSEHKVVGGSGRHRVVRSGRGTTKRYPEAETVPTAAQVEQRFMEWMLRDNARPGTAINELELARKFGVATTGIREFLNRFQRFGLIEKRPNAGWVFKGFTTDFALELFEIREMFELRSARAFASLPESSDLWQQIEALRSEHLALLEQNRAPLPRFLRSRQSVSSSDQLGRAQPIHRRLLRHHHFDFPLSLPVEQARRTAAQRGRDPRASHLHRCARRPKSHQGRTRLPSSPHLGQGNPDAIHVGRATGPTRRSGTQQPAVAQRHP